MPGLNYNNKNRQNLRWHPLQYKVCVWPFAVCGLSAWASKAAEQLTLDNCFVDTLTLAGIYPGRGGGLADAQWACGGTAAH